MSKSVSITQTLTRAALLKQKTELELERDEFIKDANEKIRRFQEQANQQVAVFNGRVQQIEELLKYFPTNEEEE